MPAETLLQKWPDRLTGFVRQQLRLDAMDTRGLLQRLNDVSEQALFNLVPVWSSASVADKQIANHSFTLLINKKGVPENIAALDGSIAGQDFRV